MDVHKMEHLGLMLLHSFPGTLLQIEFGQALGYRLGLALPVLAVIPLFILIWIVRSKCLARSHRSSPVKE